MDLRLVSRVISFAVFTAWGIRAADLGFQINGNCTAGSCPAQPLGYNAAATLPFNSTVTLANGDAYSVQGSFSTSNNTNGGSLAFTYAFVVTYLGNGKGGSSQDDTIKVDALSAFQSAFSNGSFSQSLGGIFGPGISNSSSVQICEGSSCVGPISPPGVFFASGGSYPLTSSNGAFFLTTTSPFISELGLCLGHMSF